MGVEIVEHQHNPLRVRKCVVDQVPDRLRPVDGGALRGNGHPTRAQVRGAPQQQIGAAGAHVLAVLARRVAGPQRQAGPPRGAQGLPPSSKQTSGQVGSGGRA
jgi:hypothetical protein